MEPRHWVGGTIGGSCRDVPHLVFLILFQAQFSHSHNKIEWFSLVTVVQHTAQILYECNFIGENECNFGSK